jgi:hypothetical protein
MKCMRIIDDPDRYWNIKGWGHFVVCDCFNCLFFRFFAEGRIQRTVAPLWHHPRKVIFHG